MTKRMLIDATHPEETRVVVVDGNKLEEFDYETASKKQLKGNIYLAKVTRVEPSLQAAFVEYGGNRHGFLAFSEIHPDYYQIPVSDRRALEQEQAEAETESKEEPGSDAAASASAEGTAEEVETVSGEDMEEVAVRRPPTHRYKIQEVIKRRQIMLVQVVKEERGNKGAALTTYLSLAGRYCVLMPNTGRGGGISRKIVSAEARKRLKEVVSDLEVPAGMAVIVRTAGQERKKPEIKRDFEYLMRAWDSIRDLTMQSVAPALIYEEGNLIKRAIRDLYNTDIDEILVEGEEGYKAAKDFMKMMIPSRARHVKRYRDAVPLFHRHRVESQLDTMHSPTMQLPSGGYIVLNPTEALVAVDVNSGRSTRERNIEETALKTNLEAADEVARQLRLRDLAGLVVIDFIDMEETRNMRAVEKRLKDAMKSDRARIQVGRISSFGLLELSRQRLRPSLHETIMEVCSHCAGSGVVRSTESTALQVLRAIEEEGMNERTAELVVHVPTEVAFYILNQKRSALTVIEQRYGLEVTINADEALIPPASRFERLRQRAPGEEIPRPVAMDSVYGGTDEEETDTAEEAVAETAARPEEAPEGGRRRRSRRKRRREDETPVAEVIAEAEATDVEAEAQAGAESAAGDEAGEEAVRKRRRRGRRGGRRRARSRSDTNLEQSADAEGESEALEEAPGETEAAEIAADVPAVASEDAIEAPVAVADAAETIEVAEEAATPAEAEAAAPEAAEAEATAEPEPEAEEKPKPARRRRRTTRKAAEETPAAEEEAKPARRPATRRRRKTAKPEEDATDAAASAESAPVVEETPSETAKPANGEAKPEGEAETAAESRPSSGNGADGHGGDEPAEDRTAEPGWSAQEGDDNADEDQPSGGGAPTEGDRSDRPRRRGWWQRLTGN